MELLLDDNILGELTSFEMLRQNFGPNFFSHFRPIYDSTYNNASQFLLSRFSSRKSRLYRGKLWSWKLKNLCRANFLPIYILGARKVWLRRLEGELVVWKGGPGLRQDRRDGLGKRRRKMTNSDWTTNSTKSSDATQVQNSGQAKHREATLFGRFSVVWSRFTRQDTRQGWYQLTRQNRTSPC